MQRIETILKRKKKRIKSKYGELDLDSEPGKVQRRKVI